MQPLTELYKTSLQESAANNGRVPIRKAVQVRRILVANGKGGCGKTTIATNIASYFASQGFVTALMDYDPQGSSTQWLNLRPDYCERIYGVEAHRRTTAAMTRTFQTRVPPDTQRVVLDAPAGVCGIQLIEMVREVDTVIIPVLPSPIDIHAASRFIQDLILVAKVRSRSTRVGVIANRVKTKSRTYQPLERFLNSLDLDFIGQLRDGPNYIRAAEEGVGIFELHAHEVERDRRHWRQVIHWIEQGDASPS